MKLRTYANEKDIQIRFSDDFDDILTQAESYLSFKELNFGDDGTLIAPWMVTSLPKNEVSRTLIRTSLSVCASKFLCLRKQTGEPWYLSRT